MISTAQSSDKEEGADEEIAACLNLNAPKSFFLYAGAGSGKTRTLVNAINKARVNLRRDLQIRGGNIGVITYTNAACDEIVRRLDFDPLVSVSTIHSFAWTLIAQHSGDIRECLRIQLAKDIAELEGLQARGRAGSKAAIDRARSIEQKNKRLGLLDSITKFVYSPTGDNRGRDSLSHSEVISITSHLLTTKISLQHILISRHPILLIDESQDTNKNLMDSLLHVQNEHKNKFILGLLGDTMQRIYADGKAKLGEAIPGDWAKPKKATNHRCPQRVIELINRIREPVDGQKQNPGDGKNKGTVRLFIAPAGANWSATEQFAAQRMADITGDSNWLQLEGYKALILEHHMAARRLGFEAMFSALYKMERHTTALLDGTMPALRLFSTDVAPLVAAATAGNEYEIATIMRSRSPLLRKEHLEAAAEGQISLLTACREAVERFIKLWEEHQSPTFLQVLIQVSKLGLFPIPEQLRAFAQPVEMEEEETGENEDEDESEANAELSAWREFLDSPFDQILSYSNYVSGKSKFATHQGVKGLEFPRVMVVISDEETRGFLFSYGKLFGAKERTDTDIRNERSGQETSMDRTRRLFYVTCSRAEDSLAVVTYSETSDAVVKSTVASGWFSRDEIEILPDVPAAATCPNAK